MTVESCSCKYVGLVIICCIPVRRIHALACFQIMLILLNRYLVISASRACPSFYEISKLILHFSNKQLTLDPTPTSLRRRICSDVTLVFNVTAVLTTGKFQSALKLQSYSSPKKRTWFWSAEQWSTVLKPLWKLLEKLVLVCLNAQLSLIGTLSPV